MTDHIIVLGAGVVGVAVAIALQRDGHRVTLVDRDEPGRGASFGNSGFIHTGGNIPLATPGIMQAAAKMLFDEEAPLVLRWRHLPRLLPWIWQFARRSRPEAFLEDARALSELTNRAVPAWRKLSAAAGTDHLFGARGELYLYRSREKFEATREEFDLRRDLGVDVQEVGHDDIRQMEPVVAPDLTHGWYLADSMYVKSPFRLVQELAAHAVANGGTVERMAARAVTIHERGIRLTGEDGKILDADRLVIAAGAHSKPFARQVGARVPLETLRGYHVMLAPEAVPLQGPIIDAEKKFGVVPMEEGIRISGMLELANLTAAPNDQRAGVLLRLARDLVPGLPDDEQSRWLGHRPGIPDSRPVIGPAPWTERVTLAFGHGTIGLTLAAITGELVADLVAGRTPVIDMTAVAPARF